LTGRAGQAMLNLTWPRKSEQQADENARLSSAVKHNKKTKKKNKKKRKEKSENLGSKKQPHFCSILKGGCVRGK